MNLGLAAFIKKLASKHLLSNVISSGVIQAKNRKGGSRDGAVHILAKQLSVKR